MEGTGKRWCGAVTHRKAGKSLSVSGGSTLGRGTDAMFLGQRAGWGKLVTGDRSIEMDRQMDDGPAWGDSDPQWLLAAQQFPPGYMASSPSRFPLPRQSISKHASVQTPGIAQWGLQVLGRLQPLLQGGRWELG